MFGYLGCGGGKVGREDFGRWVGGEVEEGGAEGLGSLAELGPAGYGGFV